MPPNGGGLGECKKCRDGSWECGDDPCQAGGGGVGDWAFRGTAWLPVEIGLDAAIRVYARVRFKIDDDGRPVLGRDGLPLHTIDVHLDMPLRAGCVQRRRCSRDDDE